jgi:hypothetical protein
MRKMCTWGKPLFWNSIENLRLKTLGFGERNLVQTPWVEGLSINSNPNPLTPKEDDDWMDRHLKYYIPVRERKGEEVPIESQGRKKNFNSTTKEKSVATFCLSPLLLLHKSHHLNAPSLAHAFSLLRLRSTTTPLFCWDPTSTYYYVHAIEPSNWSLHYIVQLKTTRWCDSYYTKHDNLNPLTPKENNHHHHQTDKHLKYYISVYIYIRVHPC